MATLLQIVLLLVLIALFGIILGYLIGKISCKREEHDSYIDKNTICEDRYRDNLIANRNSENDRKKDISDNETEIQAINGESKIANEDNVKSDIDTQEQGLNDTNPVEIDKSIEQDNNEESKALNIAKSEVIQDELENSQSEDNKVTNNEQDENIENNTNEENNQNKPQMLSNARDGEADNLCKIKGIGKVIEGKLNNLGIFHFDQIASWSEKEIAWVDKHLSFTGRIIREDWVGQAKLLARGEETEFSKRVERGEVESSKAN